MTPALRGCHTSMEQKGREVGQRGSDAWGISKESEATINPRRGSTLNPPNPTSVETRWSQQRLSSRKLSAVFLLPLPPSRNPDF